MKLVPFILIINGTPKQHKMMPRKDLNQSLKGLSWFKANFGCVLIVASPNMQNYVRMF